MEFIGEKMKRTHKVLHEMGSGWKRLKNRDKSNRVVWNSKITNKTEKYDNVNIY